MEWFSRLREVDRRINFLARRMKAAKVTDPAAQLAQCDDGSNQTGDA